MSSITDRSIRICADRGGTFCDVHASYPDPDKDGERKEIVVKLREQYSPYTFTTRDADASLSMNSISGQGQL